MSERLANLLGAVALGLSDDILAAAGRHVPNGGCTAAALSVVGHAPGSSIDLLARALGLSHPGAVRLVDRLEAAGLVVRRPAEDGRARALHLTAAGRRRRAALLADRRTVLEAALRRLSAAERKALAGMLEKMLPDLVGGEPVHAYRVCRLCEEAVCRDCPVEAAFAPGAGAAEGADAT